MAGSGFFVAASRPLPRRLVQRFGYRESPMANSSETDSAVRSDHEWSYAWHLWRVIMPRRSIARRLIWGIGGGNHGGRWIYEQFVEFSGDCVISNLSPRSRHMALPASLTIICCAAGHLLRRGIVPRRSDDGSHQYSALRE
jgi:hypothetical protein